jgi:lysophospholipase L1-like esterase
VRAWRPILTGGLALALAACDGGSPTGVSPTPPPTLYTVEALVFYDENSNGVRDAAEVAVVPGAEVLIASRAARAAPGTGRVTVNNVPGGTFVASLVAASLPPYYIPGAPVEVTVPLPEGEIVELGARLPIGQNRIAIYMGFGDSITVGDGSSDYQGYRPRLQQKLREHFGQGTVEDQGIEGTRSSDGSARIALTLRRNDPAYTLILYGTNDWNAPTCRENPDPPCQTVGHLRNMVRSVKAASSLPILGTIIPVNSGYDGRAPESRNEWVADINDQLRAMAAEEGAVLADLHHVFLNSVPDYHTLFTDHVHPNDQGYAIMADEWFRAITTPPARGSSVAGAPPRFGFEPAP